uniref:Uncharacterized protein n=2 Tax=Branchiostoma floridae TaxID=7739 RepID=C3XWX1_BRAFL|eukprot:XP_002611221.1 hypothetical protein BRAFLDRAFT_71181 [Branchiostoma floridae]
MATVTDQRAVTICTQTDFQSEGEDEGFATASEEKTSSFGQDVGQDAEWVEEDVAEEAGKVSDAEDKEEEGDVSDEDEREDAPTEISLEIHVRKIQRKREGDESEKSSESEDSVKNEEDKNGLEDGQDDVRTPLDGEEMEIHGKGLKTKMADNGTFQAENSKVTGNVTETITENRETGKDSMVKFVEGRPHAQGPLMLLPSSITQAQTHYVRYARTKTPTKSVGTDPLPGSDVTDTSGAVVNNMEDTYRISQPPSYGKSKRQGKLAAVHGTTPSLVNVAPPGDSPVMSRRSVRSIPSPELEIKLHGGNYSEVRSHVTGSDDSDVDDDEAWLDTSRKLTTTPASLPADPDMTFDLLNQRFRPRQTKSLASGRSRHHAARRSYYRQALTIMSARCNSVARMRIVEGSTQAQSMDPTYYHYPDKYIYLEQESQQHVPPIKVWRGYGGNLYFEPMACQTKPYSDPDERPSHRGETDSAKGLAKPARLSTALSSRTSKSSGSHTTSSSEHSARSEPVSDRSRGQRTFPLTCVKLDKTVVLNRNNSSLQEDLSNIAGIEAVGSLRISYPKHNNKKQTPSTPPSRERHSKSAKICKGLTSRTRNSLNNKSGGFRGLAVEGETRSPKTSPRNQVFGDNTSYMRTRFSDPVARNVDTSLSYARSVKTPCGTPVTPELYGYNNDRLPPLELVQASVRRRRDQSPDVVIPSVRMRDGRTSTASFETFSTVGNE